MGAGYRCVRKCSVGACDGESSSRSSAAGPGYLRTQWSGRQARGRRAVGRAGRCDHRVASGSPLRRENPTVRNLSSRTQRSTFQWGIHHRHDAFDRSTAASGDLPRSVGETADSEYPPRTTLFVWGKWNHPGLMVPDLFQPTEETLFAIPVEIGRTAPGQAIRGTGDVRACIQCRETVGTIACF